VNERQLENDTERVSLLFNFLFFPLIARCFPPRDRPPPRDRVQIARAPTPLRARAIRSNSHTLTLAAE